MSGLARLGLCEYVPYWPSYQIRRLVDVVLTNGDETLHFDVAYRLRTFVGEREIELIMPLPDCLDELPLDDSAVVASIEQAVTRTCRA